MTRRSNGEGSFYQQKDKSWVYQVTYGRKEDGKPFRKAFKGRTKNDLQRAPAHNGKKNRRVSRRRRKHRRRNPPASKNSAPSSVIPSSQRRCSQRHFPCGLISTNLHLPGSLLPTQAIWTPIESTSRKPLETCRSTRSPRTPYRTIIKGSRKTAAALTDKKAAYPQRPFKISTCC